jgi:hypothetical protein
VTAAALTAVFFGLSAPALAQEAPPSQESNVDFEVYGFAQFDGIVDINGRMNPDWVDAFRPSRIATPEGQFGSDGETSFSIKQSRLGAKASGEAAGHPWEAKFEFDMFGVGDNAGQVAVRFRHGYGRWGPVLAGQTNSVFMDGDIFPNVIDYWGPAGMVFLRTPQVRLTLGNDKGLEGMIAVEHATNDIDPGGIRLIDEDIAGSIRGKNELPDLTAAVRYGGDWGHVRLGGILRKISYETPSQPDFKPEGHRTGWGLNLTGVAKVADMATFRGGVVYGKGIASYMNDGGMDLAPSAPPQVIPPIFPFPTEFLVLEAKPVPLLGISAYVDLNWTKELSSSFGYSETHVDNTNFQTADTFHRGQYASGNLLWTPIPRIMTGAELMWGQRTNNDDTKGEDWRLQVSFKISFSSKDLKL